jgi:hypothetical protein
LIADVNFCPSMVGDLRAIVESAWLSTGKGMFAQFSNVAWEASSVQVEQSNKTKKISGRLG